MQTRRELLIQAFYVDISIHPEQVKQVLHRKFKFLWKFNSKNWLRMFFPILKYMKFKKHMQFSSY